MYGYSPMFKAHQSNAHLPKYEPRRAIRSVVRTEQDTVFLSFWTKAFADETACSKRTGMFFAGWGSTLGQTACLRQILHSGWIFPSSKIHLED